MHFFCVCVIVCTYTKYLEEEISCLKFIAEVDTRCWAQGSIILSVGMGRKRCPKLGKELKFGLEIF